MNKIIKISKSNNTLKYSINGEKEIVHFNSNKNAMLDLLEKLITGECTSERIKIEVSEASVKINYSNNRVGGMQIFTSKKEGFEFIKYLVEENDLTNNVTKFQGVEDTEDQKEL